MLESNEKECIEKAKSGDSIALNHLIDNYKDFAYSVARTYHGDEDAKDIVQEAFIQVFLNMKKFRNESKFSTWLYRIVYNQCYKHSKNTNNNIVDLDKTQYLFSNDKSDQLINDSDRNRIINDALKNLTSSEYTVIQLFYLAEKTVNEIVEITNMSKSNIKTTLHRTRNKIKQNLIDNNDTY